MKFKSSLFYAVIAASLSYYLFKFSGLGLPNAILFSLIGLFSASLILNDSKYDNAISSFVLIGITISLFVFKFYSISYLVALGTCMLVLLVNSFTKKHFAKNIILSGLSIFALTYPNLKIIINDIQSQFSFIIISISLSILPLIFSAYKYFKADAKDVLPVSQVGSQAISQPSSREGSPANSQVGSPEGSPVGYKSDSALYTSDSEEEGSLFYISEVDSDEEGEKFEAGKYIAEMYDALLCIKDESIDQDLIALLKKFSCYANENDVNEVISKIEKFKQGLNSQNKEGYKYILSSQLYEDYFAKRLLDDNLESLKRHGKLYENIRSAIFSN